MIETTHLDHHPNMICATTKNPALPFQYTGSLTGILIIVFETIPT